MADFLTYSFLQHAVLAAVLSSGLCGILGAIVVARRLVILAGGVAHAAYGGVGLAFLCGVNPLVGASAFTVGCAVLMAEAVRRFGGRADTVVGALWAFGMAVGVIAADLTPGYGADLMSYLFGSILTVTRADLLLEALLLGVVAGFVVRYYRELLAISYDEEYAVTRGVPVRALNLALVVLVSLGVVLIIRVIGLILVIAMLTIPPHIAERFSRSLGETMLWSVGLNLLFSLAGLVLAYEWNLTTGAVIVLLAASAYTSTLLFGAERG